MRRQWSTSTPPDEKLTLAVVVAFLKQTNGIQRLRERLPQFLERLATH
jgi:hypothetical protein